MISGHQIQSNWLIIISQFQWLRMNHVLKMYEIPDKWSDQIVKYSASKDLIVKVSLLAFINPYFICVIFWNCQFLFLNSSDFYILAQYWMISSNLNIRDEIWMIRYICERFDYVHLDNFMILGCIWNLHLVHLEVTNKNQQI